MIDTIEHGGREIRGVARIEGPIVVAAGVGDVGYDEVAEVIDPQGRVRQGRVLESGEGVAVIEVFAGTTGLSIEDTRIRFQGRPMRLPVSLEMLGRVFDGLGAPMDGGPEPLPEQWVDVSGQPINPTARVYPRDYIQTGVSVLDGMNTLVLGQKLPIFSGSGMPHDQLAAQLVRQASLPTMSGEAERGEFAIVFAAMGVKHDVADFFREAFITSGALTRVAMFLNLADDPPIERLVTPRAALTLAEFLAFERALLRDPHFHRIEPERTERVEGTGATLFDLRFLYDPEAGRRAATAWIRSRSRVTWPPCASTRAARSLAGAPCTMTSSIGTAGGRAAAPSTAHM